MAHYSRELIDDEWYQGMAVQATTIRNIDEKTKKAVSATGGSWAPSSPIVIGGEGLELQCGMSVAGGAVFKPGTNKYFKFGDDDYFKFDSPVSRVIDDSPALLTAEHNMGREARVWMSTNLTVTPAVRTRRAGAKMRFPLRIPDGARLQQVVVSFKVGQTHASVPAQLPRARVVRMSASGTIEKYPYQTNSDYEPDGWVFPTRPASGALWYASGALQTFTLSYDQTNGPRADTSLYSYGVEWWEEEGSNAFADDIGNYVVHFRMTVYSPDLRPY